MRIISLFVLVLSSLALVACNNMQSPQKEKEKKCQECDKPCDQN